MPDRFSDNAPSSTATATHAFSITPNDAAGLGETTRAIYCGNGGDVAVAMSSGATVIFSNVPDGAILPVRATKVAATGTTASALLGLV